MQKLRYKVLKGISEGLYPSKVARILGKSKQTVDYHVQALVQAGSIKSDVRSSSQCYEVTMKGKKELIREVKNFTSKSEKKSGGHRDETYTNSNNLIEALKVEGWDSLDSIHNLRFKVVVDGLYKILKEMNNFYGWNYISSNAKFETAKRLPDCMVRIFVTSGDTVEVMIGCSDDSIPVISSGFSMIASVLGVVRQVLYDLGTGLDIPSVGLWIFDGLERNRDSAMISGKSFNLTFRRMDEIFRLYFKDPDKDGVGKLRVEKLENPGVSFDVFKESQLNAPAKILEVVSRIQEDMKQFSGIREDINILTEAQGKMANVLSLMVGGNDSKTSLVESVSRDEQDKRFYG